jgi:predicted nucleotidyltransferase
VTALEHAVAAAARDLRELGARFALIGGLAVSARAEPRLTRDADFAVAVDTDADAEALVRQLMSRGHRLVASIEQTSTARLASVRLTQAETDHSVVIDLLFASSGIESDVVTNAEVLAILPGLELPVASTGHLIALKLLARDDRLRPTDADDLDALARVASATDWEVAKSAVEAIASRGFHRGRDLQGSLTRLRTGMN